MDKDFENLFKKYVDGNCSEEEKAIVESWYLNELKTNAYKIDPTKIPEVQKEIWDKITRDNHN